MVVHMEERESQQLNANEMIEQEDEMEPTDQIQSERQEHLIDEHIDDEEIIQEKASPRV